MKTTSLWNVFDTGDLAVLDTEEGIEELVNTGEKTLHEDSEILICIWRKTRFISAKEFDWM